MTGDGSQGNSSATIPDPVAGIGDRILKAAVGCERSAFLVAPFAKQQIIGRLLDVVSATVEVTLVTRWRPEEVASGVSDLEVLDLIRARGRGGVRLRHHLHAKYYRFDDRVFAGSANLTARAFGWIKPENDELLIELERPLPEFEQWLNEGSVEATDQIAEGVRQAAAHLESTRETDPTPEAGELGSPSPALEWFLPRLRNPDELLRVYAGDQSSLSEGALRDAKEDLRGLDLPPGLSHEAALAFTRSALQMTPTFQLIDRLVASSRRFGEVRDHLRIGLDLGTREEANRIWQTWSRWLLFFFSDRFRMEPRPHSEIIERITD